MLYFLTDIPIINERVSISILVSTEKNHWRTTVDEMYLQKCEEYSFIQLYTGLFSFMIVVLKENVPYNYQICSRAKHWW